MFKDTGIDSFTDKYGACKICEGEIPYGHQESCYIYEQEKKIKSLSAEGANARAIICDWLEMWECSNEPKEGLVDRTEAYLERVSTEQKSDAAMYKSRTYWGGDDVLIAADDGRADSKQNMCPRTHRAADEFWRVWREIGEPHKRGYYESTWMAIDAALAATCDHPHFSLGNRCAVCGDPAEQGQAGD